MATYAQTPQGHRVRIEPYMTTDGIHQCGGKVYFGAEGPYLSDWHTSQHAANKTLEEALAAADTRIEATGLTEEEVPEHRPMTLRLRVSPAEKATLQKAAEDNGQTVSRYIRDRVF